MKEKKSLILIFIVILLIILILPLVSSTTIGLSSDASNTQDPGNGDSDSVDGADLVGPANAVMVFVSDGTNVVPAAPPSSPMEDQVFW